MHKQYAFALSLLFSFNIFSQEGPGKPSSSRSSSPYDLQRESLQAVILSTDLEPMPNEFCKSVITNAPDRARRKITLLTNPALREHMFPNLMLLHGPTGSGKTTLGIAIAQEIGLPFILVRGSMLANEYANSASAGLKRIESLATNMEEGTTIVVDEMDPLTKPKRKNNNQYDNETPQAFWQMLDMIRNKKLFLIGTTNDISGMPEPMQNRFKGYLFEIPYRDNSSLFLHLMQASLNNKVTSGMQTPFKKANRVLKRCSKRVLDAITPKLKDEAKLIDSINMALNGKSLIDEKETLKDLIKILKGFSNREINTIISLAHEHALEQNLSKPILTLSDFNVAINYLEQDGKALSKRDWDRKEIFTYSVQTIGALAALAAIIHIAHSIKNSNESLALAIRNSDYNIFNGDRMHTLGVANQNIAIAGMEQAKKIADDSKDFQLRLLLAGTIIAGTAAQAAACTIS